MLQRTPWTARTFTFDFPEGWLFNICERLAGTPARLHELINGLSEEQLRAKSDHKWSIKENIGHLADLEELHEGRIDDFIARKEILRAADMKNEKTVLANHNDQDVKILIDDFASKRMKFIKRIHLIDDDLHGFRSIHPRLQVPMRIVDVAFFTAEHDDHHLASIREMINQFQHHEY